MAQPSTPSLAIAVAVLLVGALATVALTQWDPTAEPPLAVIDDEEATEGVDPPTATDTGTELVEVPTERTAEIPLSLDTTVIWPLEVRLDLVEDLSLPEVPAGPPLGSGRNARLSGRIANASGDPVPARIRFDPGGPNAGRELLCDASGRFGATDLVPGMAIVEVTGPGIIGSRREVRLREGQDELLNIGYGRPGTVQGRVVGENGDGVVGARVSLDGQVLETGEDGTFFFPEVAAGRCLLEISQEGFVDYRTLLGVAGGYTVEAGALQFVLRRPCSLRLILRPNIGGPEPALVYLMPANSNRERAFPWHTVNPILLTGDAPVVVEDLPEGAIHIRTFRTGAEAQPAYKQVQLNAGDETEAVIRLEPAPVVSGAVFDSSGEAAAGATVRLSAADVARASQRLFPTSDQLWLEHVLPLMPSVEQVVTTDTSGRFRLTSWSDVSPFRLLEITSQDGSQSLAMVVGPEHDNAELELRLAATEREDARLEVVIPGRTQALPVEVVVNGAPRDGFVLAASQDLEIEGLVPGVYRLEVVWHGERVAKEPSVVIVDSARDMWTLPQEAIEGQSAETWRKLGRPYPGPSGGD
ncbi:carboxypeptidase-like regulatory domain-containing protein [Rohdeia mirabilis]|uniref:carboxypeptidase-like regulatory domain-containing protein n=1 Tax=Rohdeia mirabilis TaxID=2528008 RepID=UPI003AF33BA6